jgi:hypothetical protein
MQPVNGNPDAVTHVPSVLAFLVTIGRADPQVLVRVDSSRGIKSQKDDFNAFNLRCPD